MPVDSDAVRELERSLSLLASRDLKRRYIEAVVSRAGLDLSPAAAWLLVQFEENPELDIAATARMHRVARPKLEAATAELEDRGLLRERIAGNGGTPHREPTRRGRAVLRRLVNARRARLMEVIAEWHPERRAVLALRVQRLARQLVPDTHRGNPHAPSDRSPS